MSMFAEFLPLLDPKFLAQIFRLLYREFGSTALGRRLGGLIILSIQLSTLIGLMFRPAVTAAMYHIGYGSSEALAQRLKLVSVVCMVLYAVPAASIVGAILLAGWLCAALVSHARSGGMLSVCILLGICVAWLVWGGAWRRERDLRLWPVFRRRQCCIES